MGATRRLGRWVVVPSSPLRSWRKKVVSFGRTILCDSWPLSTEWICFLAVNERARCSAVYLFFFNAACRRQWSHANNMNLARCLLFVTHFIVVYSRSSPDVHSSRQLQLRDGQLRGARKCLKIKIHARYSTDV